MVEGETCELLGPSYRFHLSHGHTPGLLLTEIATPAGSVTFMGDLVPGVSWVHAPITMGYDRYPELLINEKVEMLQSLADNHSWAFFTHDPHVAAAKILRDEKGRFHAISSCERVAWLQP